MKYRHILPIFITLLLSFFGQANTATEQLDFFSTPDMVMAQISPNGKYIVAIRHHGDKQKIVLINTSSQAESLLLDLSENYSDEAAISNLVWIDEHHIATQLIEIKKGIENLLDTQSSYRLLIINIQNKPQVLSVRTKGWLVDSLPAEAGMFLYAKSSIYSKVYKLNVNKLAAENKKLNKLSKIDGGQFTSSNEITQISGFAIRWFFDFQNKPVAVLHFGKDRQLTLSAYDNISEPAGNKNKIAYSSLKTWPKSDKTKQKHNDEKIEKKLLPIKYAGIANNFYCLDSNEEQKRTVYLVDFKTEKQTSVYQADSYEIIDIELSKVTQTQNKAELSSVKVINNGVVENIFVNQTQKKNKQKNLLLSAELSSTLTGDKTIVYKESHNNAGKFYLRTAQKDSLIGEKYPHLPKKLKSQLIEGKVNVEGLTIPYLLSMPTGINSSYPLIVMPHGGPIGVFDRKYYNPIVQSLIAKKYAVLQVNYRGSGGYSKALQDAGKDQWGGLMLEDIYQATLAVAKRNDIQQQNICSFGMSYGGYAALMLTIKHPNTYKCAANWAGVTDLNLYVNNPRMTSKQRTWAKNNIGIIDWPYQKLQENSPAYMVKNLNTPVLIAHGRKDEIVDIEHSYRMKLMLDKYNKTYEWYEDKEGSHSFGSLKQSKQFFDRLKIFLSKYIKKPLK